MEYKKSFAYHIEVELDLDINKIWNFEKNTVSPYEITKSSSKKVWLYCQEKDYHNDEGGYEVRCDNFYNGKRCGYCGKKHKIHKLDSFAQWGIDTFGENFLEKYWSKKNTIDPYTIAPQCNKKVWLYCQEKGYHNDEGGYETTCNNFYSGNRCGYCNSFASHKVHKLDSLAHLYPQIAEMIVTDERNNLTMEDLYKIAPYSNKKFYFKCSKCEKGSSKKRKLSDIMINKFSCEYCSDGISVPEKFMMNLLNRFSIEFITQLSKSTFKWCQDYRYDFYIPSLNMIIETHGIQHYEKSNRGRTLKEEQLNDKCKKELALNNDIEKYIIIDCRYSKFDWLKENVIKELNSYFNLSNINWELIWEESQNSLVWEVKKLYDLGYTNKKIAEILNIDRHTVTNYKRKLNL